MKTIEAKDWNPKTATYIWEETGEGSLRLVTSMRPDWWIVTGYCSWCCCPDTTLYTFANDAERAEVEKALRHRLEIRREQWGKSTVAV